MWWFVVPFPHILLPSHSAYRLWIGRPSRSVFWPPNIWDRILPASTETLMAALAKRKDVNNLTGVSNNAGVSGHPEVGDAGLGMLSHAASLLTL
jgi:hypothetical protein